MNHLEINKKAGTIFIQNENINEWVCMWKHNAFDKHKGANKIFVETGTNTGNGIANAFGVGFKNIYSIEIDNSLYQNSVLRWQHKPSVKIYNGPTSTIIENILKEINEPCFFWLDAHFNTSKPTYEELAFIKEHGIKNHTILIDDISRYFDRSHIEKTILDINPQYQFFYEPTPNHPQEILVAKIL
jgi:hypothetical protein